MTDNKVILFPGEAEQIIQTIKPILPEHIPSKEWYKQQNYIEKLNVQAVLSATNKSDEFIKEFLITHQKLDVLVENLICLELWIENVFKCLVQQNYKPKNSFVFYTVLYHEATIVNLLETVLYHVDSLESLDKGLIDMFDYAYRRLVELSCIGSQIEERRQVYRTKTGGNPVLIGNDEVEDQMKPLEYQCAQLRYEISLKCISIMNYFICNMTSLPLTIANRIYCSCDMPGLFVGLVQNIPWTVQMENGLIYKFIDNKWVEQANWIEVRANLSKLDGQIWIALYQMLSNINCREKYELGSFRKGVLLGIRGFLTDQLLEKLPMLMDMRRFLEQLSISDVPTPKPNLVLEQIAEMLDSLTKSYAQRWPVLQESVKEYLNSSGCQEDIRKLSAEWADIYTGHDDIMSSLFDASGVPRCPICGHEATKRCSRCKSEWYCSRHCQINHWKKHKPACDLMKKAETNQ